MRKLTATAALILMASQASAVSNMERTVILDMQRAGLSAECIANLTTSDAARINGIKNNGSLSNGTKNRRVKDAYRRICER